MLQYAINSARLTTIVSNSNLRKLYIPGITRHCHSLVLFIEMWVRYMCTYGHTYIHTYIHVDTSYLRVSDWVQLLCFGVKRVLHVCICACCVCVCVFRTYVRSWRICHSWISFRLMDTDATTSPLWRHSLIQYIHVLPDKTSPHPPPTAIHLTM